MESHLLKVCLRRSWLPALLLGLILALGAFSPAAAQGDGPGSVPSSHTDCESGDDGAECELTGRIAELTEVDAGQQALIAQRWFLITDATQIDATAGAVEVGACVVVRFVRDGETPYTLTSLAVQAGDACTNDDDGGDDGGDHGNDEQERLHGLINALPAADSGVDSDLYGEWRIDDERVTVDADTELVRNGAMFVAGETCVAVSFTRGDEEPYAALRIEIKNDCNGDDDDGGDHGNDEQERLHGLIDALPAADSGVDSDLYGEWRIDDERVTVDADTELVRNGAMFVAGETCVAVSFTRGDEEPYAALRIEIKNDCNGDDDDDDHGNYGDDAEFKGQVVSVTEDSIVAANSRAGEVSFTIDANTVIDDEYGALGAGSCVEIDYDPSTDPFLALKIEVERDYRCTGDDGEGSEHGHLYGALTEIGPVPGAWLIGGVSFSVTEATALEPRGGEFAVGDMVKVDFYVTVDANTGSSIFTATRIRTEYDHHGGHDDDHNGVYDGAEGKLYATVDSMGDSAWRVGGVDFVIDADVTRIRDEIAVGDYVEVTFYLDDAGERVALKIHADDDDGDDNRGAFKLVGFVTSQPENSFVGEWSVANVSFVASSETEFDESRGLLAVGAFVRLTYTLANDGTKTLVMLETRVPPGAGDRNHVGRVERQGGQAAAASVAIDEEWVIGGAAYRVDAATRLVGLAGMPAVGDTVVVNSYTDDAGVEVATSIISVQLDNAQYMPLINR
ncbi:MAG: hypothetical protein H6642_01595 [Caldilineaceae bacterium]|nr:hypothetical protein [Caldilineaceae bacterium]